MLLLKTEPLKIGLNIDRVPYYQMNDPACDLVPLCVVCPDRLHHYFYFPEGTHKIQIEIHDHPSKNRVALATYGGVVVDGNPEFLSFTAYSLLRPFFRNHDTLYAELHYWEQ